MQASTSPLHVTEPAALRAPALALVHSDGVAARPQRARTVEQLAVAALAEIRACRAAIEVGAAGDFAGLTDRLAGIEEALRQAAMFRLLSDVMNAPGRPVPAVRSADSAPARRLRAVAGGER